MKSKNTGKSRFFGKFDALEPDKCWEWLGAKNSDGYGNFYYQGKYEKAHRAAWIIYFGEIPNGLCVCHHCDNPSCVNPKHLFLGTHADNMRDMTQKGRLVIPKKRGEFCGATKLKDKEVKEIRRLYALGIRPQSLLAKMFNVSQTQISRIVNFVSR